MSSIDRDCIVAAILTAGIQGGKNVVEERPVDDEKVLVERYVRILRTLRQFRGSKGLWNQVDSAARRKIERQARKAAQAES